MACRGGQDGNWAGFRAGRGAISTAGGRLFPRRPRRSRAGGGQGGSRLRCRRPHGSWPVCFPKTVPPIGTAPGWAAAPAGPWRKQSGCPGERPARGAGWGWCPAGWLPLPGGEGRSPPAPERSYEAVPCRQQPPEGERERMRLLGVNLGPPPLWGRGAEGGKATGRLGAWRRWSRGAGHG